MDGGAPRVAFDQELCLEALVGMELRSVVEGYGL